jgi:hypothetical protein
MSEQKTLSMTNAASESTSIRVVAVTSDAVILTYRSLPGNQPNTYGNFVAVWDDSVIPYSRPPLQKIPIPGNAPHGSLAVAGLMPQESQYIFGYAVGPQVGDICAYAHISPDGSQTDFSSSLMLLSVQPDSIILRYSLPPGCNPAQNGASVAVWQDSIGSYTNPPLITQRITGSSSTGTIAIVGVQLNFGVTYTVALLTSNSQTSMAAWVTFDVGE